MSTLYLKIMKGSDNSEGFDLIPLPVGTAVNFSNEPPQVTAGNVVYPITHSVYLINDSGITITQFTAKPADKWKVKVGANSPHIGMQLVPVEIDIDTRIDNLPSWSVGDWVITNLTDRMSTETTSVYLNGGAMGLGHSRGVVDSTFIPDLELNDQIPDNVWEAIMNNYHRTVPIAISNPLTNTYYLRIKLITGEIKYGIILNPRSLSINEPPLKLTKSNPPTHASVASDIKPMAEMFSSKPNSFEHLGWVIEDISDSMDPSQTSVALTGGYDSGGNKRSGYTTGAIISTFIERKMMDVPNEVLDEVFLKYGLHSSVKITHPEVKITYLRLSIQVATGMAPSVHFAIALDPNNEDDAQKIQELLSRRTKFQTLPNGWLAEDIGKEWVSDRVTVDTAGGYVRGSLYAKFITTKELGLPQETLKEIDSVYPDYTTLLISGGGTRSSYLRFISSTADNNRWVQYARVIADNRSKLKSVDTTEETHPLHPEN